MAQMKGNKAKLPATENKAAVFLRENLGIIIALLVLCVLLAVLPATSSSFLSTQNMFNILRQISTNMLIACAMTMVIILGGIDLSVGSIIALSGVIAAGCLGFINRSVATGSLWKIRRVVSPFSASPQCHHL